MATASTSYFPRQELAQLGLSKVALDYLQKVTQIIALASQQTATAASLTTLGATVTTVSDQVTTAQGLIDTLPKVIPEGDATLSATGVTPGSYTNTNLTVGADGRLTAAANGTAATGTVTSVDVSGGSTGLTTSGGPVTASGTITLAGTLAIASGGTGQTTAATAINALLPSQTGNSGKFLTTDGSAASWATASGGTGGIYAPMVTGDTPGPVLLANTDGACIMALIG